ncbi:MAG: nitroreductase family protein [Anaerolineales bacterium]|nr:nitroreductase family protein [Anaerolineales bacterium]
MDILQAILTRRSIRRYTGEVISDDMVHTMLEAGFAAPSATNRRPQHFVVVRDQARLERISAVQPFTRWLQQAGCAIVVCGDLRRQPLKGFMIQDCAASIQNMLLAAHGLGLGAVWGGLYPVRIFTRGLRKILHLPAWMIPVGLIGVGVRAGEKPAHNQYDEDRVFFETM